MKQNLINSYIWLSLIVNKKRLVRKLQKQITRLTSALEKFLLSAWNVSAVFAQLWFCLSAVLCRLLCWRAESSGGFFFIIYFYLRIRWCLCDSNCVILEWNTSCKSHRARPDKHFFMITSTFSSLPISLYTNPGVYESPQAWRWELLQLSLFSVGWCLWLLVYPLLGNSLNRCTYPMQVNKCEFTLFHGLCSTRLEVGSMISVN